MLFVSGVVMVEQAKLTELIALQRFERIEGVFRRHFQLGLETVGRDGERIESLCSSDCEPEFCRLVQSSARVRTRCIAERRRAVEIAAETGQSFITICHAGIVLVCVPIVDRDAVHGGMFFGKCLWEAATETLIEEVLGRLRGTRGGGVPPLGSSCQAGADGRDVSCTGRQERGRDARDTRGQDALDTQGRDAPATFGSDASDSEATGEAVTRALRRLPVVRGRQVHKAAEFLFDLLYEVGGFDARSIRWRRQRAQQQSSIGEFIQERKKLGAQWQYPLESERALLQKVKIGDCTGAKEILNSILGTILFKDIGDLGILKARLLELLSVLGRSAVEGGVDVHVMLEKNLAYFNKVMQIDSQEDLCAWISTALNEFIELVYSSQDSRKITQVRPAINYIDANYDKPLTLAEIAKASHLSPSRLAHVFKEQMGITLIDYVTSVRVEQAKELLLATDQSCTEICFQVGYNNQSYFTRTFKSVVGMTPRQFRVQNQRGPLAPDNRQAGS